MSISRRRFLQLSALTGAALSAKSFAAFPFSSGEGKARFTPPPGSVDCHMHIYDNRYPAAPGAKLLPPNASLQDYRQIQERINIQRMVIVNPSTYGTDNRIVLDAIKASNGNARGVAVVTNTITDAELAAMHEGGIRGIRFNISLGGANLDELEVLAARAASLGWHLQVVAPGDQWVELEPRLQRLRSTVVIDHMGHVPSLGGTDTPAFAALQRLLDNGRTWVKLSGPYMDSKKGEPYSDVAPVATRLVDVYSERLVWGSDWPHPRAETLKPDDALLLDLFAQWAPDSAKQVRILRDNPAKLYGFA